MTREEQIDDAGMQFRNDLEGCDYETSDMEWAFTKGAEWSDAHPNLPKDGIIEKGVIYIEEHATNGCEGCSIVEKLNSHLCQYCKDDKVFKEWKGEANSNN